MAVSFPDQIPAPVRDGFSGEFQLPLRSIKMADGSHRTVMNYMVQPRLFALVWELTWDQFKIFEGFVQYMVLDTGQDITLDFLPYVGHDFFGRFVPTDDMAYRTVYDESKNKWIVNANVEVLTNALYATSILPRPTIFPEWPSTLPRLPEKSGYGISTDIGYMRSDFEEGLAQQFQRRKSRNSEIPVMFNFDMTEMDIFEKFFHRTLGYGAFAFYMWLSNGSGESRVLCKFGDMPKMKPNGSICEVSFKLRTSGLPLISVSEYMSLTT